MSSPEIAGRAEQRRYGDVVDILSRFIEPVDRFFDDVLVIDEQDAAATRHRWQLLRRLRETLTRDFDIRELAGQADRRGQ